MSYKFLHIGVPTTKVKPNEIYVEKMKLYKAEPEHSPFFMEYIRFQDGCPFPEIMHMNPHISFEVDSIAEASKDAQVIVEPIDLGQIIISFIIKDNVILELTERKK